MDRGHILDNKDFSVLGFLHIHLFIFVSFFFSISLYTRGFDSNSREMNSENKESKQDREISRDKYYNKIKSKERIVNRN